MRSGINNCVITLYKTIVLCWYAKCLTAFNKLKMPMA